MQAQTTRTFNGNLQKLAGGLLITAALAAGALGLTTIGGLEIPGIGSNNEAASVAIPIEEDSDVFHRPTDNRSGEGFPLSLETTSIQADRVSHDRQLAAPQGEGYPLAREIPAIVAQPAGNLTHTRQVDAPQGEGFPMIERQQSETPFAPQGEGLMTGNGQ
ncbi:hypothetical protein BH23CHL2_BH23CHL2_21920 [soil metagenome]